MTTISTLPRELQEVRRADDAWRRAKEEARAKARAAAADEVAPALLARDQAVRIAFNAGHSKVRIGRLGLRTTTPAAVYESLARTEIAPNVGRSAA